MKFHYFEMRQKVKVREFLFHFPQYTGLFESFYAEYTAFVSQFHKNYIYVFVEKKRDMGIPPRLMKVLFHVHHNIYIAHKRNNQPWFRITRKVVESYFDQMHPAVLLSLLTVHRLQVEAVV